ncbi:DUF2057 family protein [Alkalimarinus coralli]|uniref:DUF2057 family protein n=1 Tax=Alkalimarinus coralli TaxID=2935863 RepID=UPI00202B4BA8|nr:DUF2057 family protein [Alkalimarinus coralli]
MLVLGRLLRSWVSLFVLVFLVGCSSTSLVKTYDGPQVDPSRSAVLSTSGGIEILSVNGKEVKKYLIPELDLNYQLLPGVNTVTFTHETLWAKPGKKEIGESNAELIVTEPMVVSFNAKAGEVYRFVFDSPDSKQEARDSVASFKAKLVDSSERFVTESSLYAEGSEGGAVIPVAAAATATTAVVATAAVSPETSPRAVAPTAPAVTQAAQVTPQGGALPAIDALKVLWDSATTEEKKEFLKWAFK